MSTVSPAFDMSVLPVAVRQELHDFYDYLTHKYALKKTRKARPKKLPAGFYQPIQVTQYESFRREEIYHDEIRFH